MATDLENKIIEVFSRWGDKLEADMKKAIHDAVGVHGGGQETALEGSVNYKVLNSAGTITFQLSMNDYWKYVEKGRRKGARGVPLDVIGKQWQNKKGINAAQVIREITIKSNAKKGIKSNPKKLNYDKAAKSLAFIIQRSIKRKGIEPRPFIDKVITKERILELKQMLAPVIKNQFILDIKK